MWQKIKRLDVVNLEKARFQITNVLQLVSSASRSFIQTNTNEYTNWLLWDQESSSFVSSNFGENNEINVSLDIERFILSINGPNDQREHLVLSGMTYPMAYGWMSIKFGSFQLDSTKFNDETPYRLERNIKPDTDLNFEDQPTYDQIMLHYSNASYVFSELNTMLRIAGKVLIEPATSNMVLIPDNEQLPKFGFSLGNKTFPEPYYYFKLDPSMLDTSTDKEGFDGIWNSPSSSFVIMTSDFLNQNQDLEYEKVTTFFVDNYKKTPQR